MDKIYIFGHQNPDTDAVTSAISLSYLKNKQGLDTEPTGTELVNAPAINSGTYVASQLSAFNTHIINIFNK